MFDPVFQGRSKAALPGGLATNSGADAFALDSASFFIPLQDAGSGVVNLWPAIGYGPATFTRATSAWALLSDGTYGLVASGSARSYYSPGGIYLGFMAEGARVNRALQSQNFGATWVAVGTPTRSAASTVLGALQLDTIGDDDGAGLEGYTQPITFVGDAVKAIELIVKKGTSTSSVVRVRDTTAGADRLLAAITWSGTVPVVTMTTGTDLTGTLAQHGSSGAYLLKFQSTAVTAASANQMELYPATTSALGTGGTGTIEWGAVQCEDAAFSSTPIITAAGVVTRNADVLTYPFAGNADATQGTVYAELSTLNALTVGAQIALSTGTANAPLFLTSAVATTRMGCFDGTTTATKTGLTDLATGVRKRASSWGSSLSVTGDGAAVATAAFDGDMGNTALGVGCFTNGNSSWFGTIKNQRIWKTQFPDASLQGVAA